MGYGEGRRLGTGYFEGLLKVRDEAPTERLGHCGVNLRGAARDGLYGSRDLLAQLGPDVLQRFVRAAKVRNDVGCRVANVVAQFVQIFLPALACLGLQRHFGLGKFHLEEIHPVVEEGI